MCTWIVSNYETFHDVCVPWPLCSYFIIPSQCGHVRMKEDPFKVNINAENYE